MNELNYMPKIITKNTYFKRDTREIVDRDKVDMLIDEEVKDFIDDAEYKYKNKIVNELTKDLKNEFVTRKLREFVDNSYLLRIKNGGIPNKDADEYTSLNRIIRKLVKDRPNDFTEVISKIVDIIKNNNLEKYNNDFIEYKEPESIDEELIEAMENEEKKVDKLTKYIHDTIDDLYNLCFLDNRKEYLEYYNNFLEKHKEEIDSNVLSYMSKFKLENELKYRLSREKNIVNLFNYILNYYSNRINWYDNTKNIVLITALSQGSNDYTIKSGYRDNRYHKIYVSKFKELHRYGTTFTLILEGE